MSTVKTIEFNGETLDIEDKNYTKDKDLLGVNALWTNNVNFNGVSYSYAFLPEKYKTNGYKLTSECAVVATINTAHGLSSISSVTVIDSEIIQINLNENYSGDLVISFMTELSK